MDHNKWIVGLTGGLGTGKSTVGHFFEELGAFVLDADAIAHETLLPDSPYYDSIRKLFPEAAAGGGLDRKKMAAVAFSDPGRKKKLEAIVHPYVFQRVMEEIYDAEGPVVIVEVPLLYEAGFERFCNEVVVVAAGEGPTGERLEEKGFSQNDIEARRRHEMPLSEKIKKADQVIENNGSLQETRQEVEKIWRQLQTRSKGDRLKKWQEKK